MIEARVSSREPLVTEPEPVHDARPEVLDQHVGVRGEVADEVGAARGGQVDADASLAGVHLREHASPSVRDDAEQVGDIRARALDPDDVGAEIAEDPPA